MKLYIFTFNRINSYSFQVVANGFNAALIAAMDACNKEHEGQQWDEDDLYSVMTQASGIIKAD